MQNSITTKVRCFYADSHSENLITVTSKLKSYYKCNSNLNNRKNIIPLKKVQEQNMFVYSFYNNVHNFSNPQAVRATKTSSRYTATQQTLSMGPINISLRALTISSDYLRCRVVTVHLHCMHQFRYKTYLST